MNKIQVGDQIIYYDGAQTAAAYSAMKTGDAERCGCSSCLNFAAQRQSAFPEYFLQLLNQLGIDPRKEGEAYECGTDRGLTIYGGWFYFVGEFVQSGERLVSDAISGFQYWFVDGKSRPKPVVDFGQKVLAVEFVTKLPWVISKPS